MYQVHRPSVVSPPTFYFYVVYNEAVFRVEAKKPIHTGVRTGCHYLFIFVFVRETVVVLTDFESCTRPISTNPRSMESKEYGLTRGTYFIASRLELHAVAGPMWISWCVLGGAYFSVCFFFFFSVFISWNAHGLLQV